MLFSGEKEGATKSLDSCQDLLTESKSENAQLLGRVHAAESQIEGLKKGKEEVNVLLNLVILSKLFIRSLVITEYSISDLNLLGTDLFPLKFPLYNLQNIHLRTPTVSSGNRYAFSFENKFIITEFLPCVSQFGDQDKFFCMNRFLS